MFVSKKLLLKGVNAVQQQDNGTRAELKQR